MWKLSCGCFLSIQGVAGNICLALEKRKVPVVSAAVEKMQENIT